MIKIATLIPTKYNDGTPVEPQVFKDFEKELIRIAGGYSIEGLTEGGYVEDGKIYLDISRRYIIIVKHFRTAREIRDLITQVGKKLKQQAMYYEQRKSKVWFLKTQ